MQFIYIDYNYDIDGRADYKQFWVQYNAIKKWLIKNVGEEGDPRSSDDYVWAPALTMVSFSGTPPRGVYIKHSEDAIAFKLAFGM